jgi:hypothetical protein
MIGSAVLRRHKWNLFLCILRQHGSALNLAGSQVAARQPETDALMILKYIAFLFAAVALGGCCVSGNGCYAPSPGTPIAWDGLGAAPTESVEEIKPKRNTRRNREMLNGIAAQSDRWSEEQAADREADANLRRQLRICTNC